MPASLKHPLTPLTVSVSGSFLLYFGSGICPPDTFCYLSLSLSLPGSLFLWVSVPRSLSFFNSLRLDSRTVSKVNKPCCVSVRSHLLGLCHERTDTQELKVWSDREISDGQRNRQREVESERDREERESKKKGSRYIE